ncbi:hypothetical protein NCC49_005517 [Naganishia albida]|nr:hypothetical protein NCC49_005517 [Naganishia albida]
MAEPQVPTSAAPVELAKELLPPPATSSTLDSNLGTTTGDASDPDPNETPAERRERLHKVPFGSRFLTEQDDVFSHNAWDHVVPPPEWEDDAKKTLDMQRAAQVSKEMKWTYNANPAMYWHRFYNINKANFFKDRNWLRLEFQELLDCAKADAGPKTVVEIGCGAGNTVFPLLAKNENPQLVIHACDYAASAVEVVKSNPMYPVPPHGKGILHSSVWDVTKPPVASQSTLRPQSAGESSGATDSEGASVTPNESSLPEGVEPNSVDIAIMIFVLSALHPLEWQRAIANVYKMLKPGGMVFIRDYGRYDLAQLRIKKGRMLEENFYIRGDGTRVYFFEAAELSEMLTGSKTAYTPVEIDQPTVEVEAEGETPLDSPMPRTPAGDDTQPGSDATEVEQMSKKLSTLAMDSSQEPEATATDAGQPLSTRFRPPGETVPEPRIEFHAHETPKLSGENEQASTSVEGVDGVRRMNPFGVDHADLGIPAQPLFRIDQLGVDRRMLVNRKKQLRMYRIWMQVKARKLVPNEATLNPANASS